MLEDDRHHYLISLLKLVVVCNLRFLSIQSNFDFTLTSLTTKCVTDSGRMRIDFPEITIIFLFIFFYFFIYFFLTRRLFKGSVGERGNKRYFNLGLGCQSSN